MGKNMPTSILDATKIQARIVIPIVKALENELGKERAHQIVGEAIAQTYVDYREKLGLSGGGRKTKKKKAKNQQKNQHLWWLNLRKTKWLTQ